MNLNDDDFRWIARRCADVVLAAVDGDGETVAQAIMEVGVKHDDSGVYALCCGLAEAVARMGRYERDDDSWHGLEVRVGYSGDQINPGQVPADSQGLVMAGQFLVAHLNDDTQLKLALFDADPIKVSTGLAKLVAAEGRHRLAENRAKDGDT